MPATPPQPTPLYFEHGTEQLFGLYHPTEKIASQQALLICAPFGHKGICTHRTLRHLAEAAAQAGTATLRFDYAGCGNSQGDTAASNPIDDWVDSIVAAARTLQRLSGATQITLLGVRLGALLACLAAPRCMHVTDLIAVAPVVSGRAYLRQLRALQMAGQDSLTLTSDFFESGGFTITPSLEQALLAVDLTTLDHAPVESALLIDRNDLPSASRLSVRLQDLGVRVDNATMSDFTLMVDDPHRCQTPTTLIDTVVQRLSRTTAPASTQASCLMPEREQATTTTSTTATTAKHSETAAYFGAPHPLLGIVSMPAAGQAPSSGLGILMLNAGAIRLIGPNRMYVPMSRHWATQGHTVLRMDIAGLGDSPHRPDQADNIVYSKHALDDVRAGIAHLRSQPGVQRVAVIGLCSGAYHAFKSAVNDLPMEAAVMINPLTFFWKEGMSLDQDTVSEVQVARDLMRHREAIYSLQTWLKLIRGGISVTRLTQIVKQSAATASANAYRKIAWSLGIKLEDDLPSELTHAAKRGIKLHFVFADADPGLKLLRSYGGKRVTQLIKQGQLDITIIANADHTFTHAEPRQRMINAVNAIIDHL